MSACVTIYVDESALSGLPAGLRRLVESCFRRSTFEDRPAYSVLMVPCGLGGGTLATGVGSWQWLDSVRYKEGLPKGMTPEEYIRQPDSPFVIIAHHQEAVAS